MNWQQIGFTIGIGGVLVGWLWRTLVRAKQKLQTTSRKASTDQPPEGFSPAEAGFLLHKRIGGRDVAATLLDIAIRSIIKFEQLKPAQALSPANFRFELIDKNKSAKPFEKLLLEFLFTGSLRTRELAGLDGESVAKVMVAVQNSIRSQLAQEHLYKQPPRPKRRGPLLLGFVVIIVAVLVVYGLQRLLPGSFGLVLAVVGLLIGGWLIRSASLSGKGIDELAELQGFRDYLAGAEKITEAKLYRQHLAYAVIFGVEKRWTARFDSVDSREVNDLVRAVEVKFKLT